MADNFKFVQAQNFSLAGAGAIVGDTEITLQSFKGIDGDLLTMPNFGLKGFGTIEPGNGALEEQIVFTGVTQNSNGTATLTGVSSVAFVDPYTESSGLAKTHAGSTTFVISNTAGFYDMITAKGDDETITGIYTFTTPNVPRMDTAPTYGAGTEEYLATKRYADSLTFAGAPDASTTQKGIVEEATQDEVDARTAAGGTAARLFINPTTLRSTLVSDIATDTGAADAYAIAPSPAITAYATGQVFSFIALHTNTTASTLNVNGLGALGILKQGGIPLQAGDIEAGMIVVVEKTAGDFLMLNPVAATPVSLAYTGAYPAGDGSAITNIPQFPLKYVSVTPVSTSSDTTETTLFTLSIPGGTLKTGNTLYFKIYCSLVDITDTKTLTLRLKYGATTITAPVITNTSGVHNPNSPILIEGYLVANGATDAQNGYIIAVATGNGNTFATPTGSFFEYGTGTATEDSTASKNLVVTSQFNNSSAQDTIVAELFVVEWIEAT